MMKANGSPLPNLGDKIVEFSGLTLNLGELFNKTRKVDGPTPRSWTRVTVILPDAYHSAKQIEDWIVANLTGRWSSYTFQRRALDKKNHDSAMVIRFEDNNDALMFKLMGGHQAHEEN